MKGKWIFHKRVPPWWRVWVLLALVVFSSWLVVSNNADAQDTTPFSETSSLPDIDPFTALLTRRGPSAVRLSSRAPQLYETTEGDKSFTFQVVGQHALIRFHCGATENTLECELLNGSPQEEIHVVYATRSPRGDVIYKDYDGHAVLRVTATGGATLYDLGSAGAGEAADIFSGPAGGGRAVLPITGDANPLTQPALSKDLVQERLQRASELMAARHALLVSFRSSNEINESDAVLADAILTSAKALDAIAADDLGARAIGERLQAVIIERREVAGHEFSDGVLTIFYDPSLGVSGRPSSATISRYLENVL